MDSLKQFWGYFDGEAPMPEQALDKAKRNLSKVAFTALQWASHRVAVRAEREALTYDGDIMFALGLNPWALRELSLEVCAALERMHERVPAPSQSGEFRLALQSYGSAQVEDHALIGRIYEPFAHLTPTADWPPEPFAREHRMAKLELDLDPEPTKP